MWTNDDIAVDIIAQVDDLCNSIADYPNIVCTVVDSVVKPNLPKIAQDFDGFRQSYFSVVFDRDASENIYDLMMGAIISEVHRYNRRLKMRFPEVDIENFYGRIEICRRKYNGDEYVFYLNGTTSCVTDEHDVYLSCDTPKNGLGYEDVVLHSLVDCTAYSLYRYHPKWILKRIHDMFHRIEAHYNIQQEIK